MKTTKTTRSETFARAARAEGTWSVLRIGILALIVAFGAAACGGGVRTTAPAGMGGGGTGGGGGGGGGTTQPPPTGNVDPASLQAFQDYVWTPYLRTYCGTACHEVNGSGPPKFADADVVLSHNAALGYVNFTTPAQSQMARKLPDFLHNCWDGNGGFDNSTANCEARAAELAAAIQQWANARAAAGIGNTTAFRSAPAMLGGSARFDQYVIAKYEFKEGQGNTVFDTSGVMPAMDLTITNMQWDPNGGLANVNQGGKAQAPASTSVKLYNRIVGANGQGGTGEYTIEAWLVPAPGDQNGPARTVSYSTDTTNRNFTLGQTNQEWIFRNRTRDTSNNGEPRVVAAAGSVSQQQELQHVVMTFDQTNGRRIFVNGVETQYQTPESRQTDISNWDPSYVFILGNEQTNNRTWYGTFKFVAIHERALTPAQIQTNFAAGPTGGSMLQFDISQLTGIPNSYVQFRVGELDSKSYVFTEPKFVVMNAGGGNGGGGNGLDGQALYQTNCATAGCHANRPVNDKSFAGIKQAIADNRGGMGFLATVLSDPEIQAISDYLINGTSGGGGGSQPVASQPLATPFDMGDMRISINGQVPAVGQTYKTFYTMVTMTQQDLSPLGAVLAKGNGPQTDVFQLEFGIFNGQDVRQPEPVLGIPTPDPNMTPKPFFDAGIRNFAQINDTMAAVTGVSKMTPAVRTMFVGLQQQLPEGNDIGSFVPSHEVSVVKLAIEYCDAMFSSGSARNAFFGGLDPFNQANRDAAFGILLDKMVGTNLAAQPARAQLMSDLVALFEGDPTNTDNAGQPAPIAGICRTGQCGAAQYQNAMRAACFAVLSSAAMTIY